MPLDHYVPQVHLKKFYSPDLTGLMYAIRKSDLKKFTTRSRDVCRIMDGSSNCYIKQDRAIEEFLRFVEPRYNLALNNLRNNSLNQESILSIAGFAAYVASCSPGAMRTNSGFLRAAVEVETEILEKRGDVPKAPDALGGRTISDLLNDGIVKIEIDPKFPQALAISNVLHTTSIFGNSIWEVLRNDLSNSPYFTSDFPVAMEPIDINIPINRIVPLAPDIAIRIVPDISFTRGKVDFSFHNLRLTSRSIKHDEARSLNRTIVRCAEDLVFYCGEQPWIEKFVEKNRFYRIESITQKSPVPNSQVIVSTYRVRAKGDSLTSFSI